MGGVGNGAIVWQGDDVYETWNDTRTVLEWEGPQDLRTGGLRWRAPGPRTDLLPLDPGDPPLSINGYCNLQGTNGGDWAGGCSQLWAVARNW